MEDNTMNKLPPEEGPPIKASIYDNEDHSDVPQRVPKRKTTWWIVGAVTLLVVAGTAIALFMTLGDSQNSEEEDAMASGFLTVAPTTDLVVTSCGPNTVVVTGDRAGDLVPDSYLVVVREDADVCRNCTPLYRKIISITPSDVSAEVFTLHTEFLTLGQVFPDLNLNASLQSMEMEPPLQCSHSVTDQDSNSSYSLVDRTSERSLQAFPESCSGWTEIVLPDGKCVYTDCVVGTSGGSLENSVGFTGYSADCFSCGHKNGPDGRDGCNNGCGVDLAKISGHFGNFDFAEACCVHDYCYSSTFRKSTCDRVLYKQLKQSCPPPTKRLTHFNLFGAADCLMLADFFYLIVSKADSAYEGAQKEQLQYNREAVCFASCSTTLLGVNCCVDSDCGDPSNVTCASFTCLHRGNPRFTLTWYGDDDLDLHVRTPDGIEIWYVYPSDMASGGYLDYDDKPLYVDRWVESLVFPTDGSAPRGTYEFWVENYEQVGTHDSWVLTVYVNDDPVTQKSGAEIEANHTYTFEFQ